ncbi:DUF4340 domain-containing protein [Maridesulfovibrio ferrireducens]|uniref:DUF4340 domain-containing protein n=1 Tax=Maridesulfovibrio ferrireducens TaxID=246191 RepID=UPI001A29C0C1|nr:DUF4340 domain-containing protein [Maridesulfovibrio ferrireducens]MBI9111536.1 DUF4340 domain-containing protein [Maridesulfovibrio ferrireducens]
MLKRFLIFLALVAIICGAFYLSSPEMPMLLSEPVWPVVKSQQVDRVDVCRRGKDCFSLVRKVDGWNVVQQGWLTAPFAETAKVSALLDVLSQGQALRYIGHITEEDGQQYGLLAPKIRIATGGGQALSLTLGEEAPSGEGFFALNSQDQDELFILSNDFVRQCDFPAGYYFNLQLLSGSSDNISSISLGHGGAFLWTLVRQKDQFAFSFPASLAGKTASSGEIDLFLHSLMETPAKGLVPEASDLPGITVCSVEVLFNDKSLKKLEVFEVEGGKDYYLANSTVQNGFFVLSKEHVDQLNKTAFGMRKRSVLSLEIGKVGSIRVLQGNQTFVGIKSDKNWESFEDRKPLLGIDMSLWRLNELKFEAEPISELSSSAVKVMELELMNVDGSRIDKVLFFSDPELPSERCWLSLGDGSGYYHVSNKLLEDLQGQIPLRK